MEIIILGCGPSSGIPMIGCKCAVCTSTNSKNNRLRSSILVKVIGQNVLIDTSPDLRAQALINNIEKIDAVIYTHAHSDHVNGIDELRSFNYLSNNVIPIYADIKTKNQLEANFPTVFMPPIPEYGWFRPALVANCLKFLQERRIGKVSILPFKQIHGSINSTGIIVNNKLAYSTDFNLIEDAEIELLKAQNLELWIVDCADYSPTRTHSHLDYTLELVNRVKPRLTVLTHMGHNIDYEVIKGILPPQVIPAYDGMVLGF